MKETVQTNLSAQARNQIYFCKFCNNSVPNELKDDAMQGKSIICEFCGQELSKADIIQQL